MIDELKMEHALDILNRKIAKFIRENKELDIHKFKVKINEFAHEEDKIHELDEETIDKVIDVYLKELKQK